MQAPQTSSKQPLSQTGGVVGVPSVVIGPLYQAKTLNVCAPEDFVCSDGMDFAAHNPTTYMGPLTEQGATFAASHLSRTA